MQENKKLLNISENSSELPEALRVFMESEEFKRAIQPGSDGKFPTHLDAVREAYKKLQKTK